MKLRYKNKSVYVVLEHPNDFRCAILHGVYTNRSIADQKARDVIKNNVLKELEGYVAVLKKTPKGPDKTCAVIFEG